eukprot:212783_1
MNTPFAHSIGVICKTLHQSQRCMVHDQYLSHHPECRIIASHTKHQAHYANIWMLCFWGIQTISNFDMVTRYDLKQEFVAMIDKCGMLWEWNMHMTNDIMNHAKDNHLGNLYLLYILE